MKRFIISLSALLAFNTIFAQQEHMHQCAEHKITAFNTSKSGQHKNLDDQDGYDVHYVKLDLTLDNLSIEIDNGVAEIRSVVTALNLDVFVLELEENLVVDSVTLNGVDAIVTRQGNELQLFPTNSFSQGDQVETIVYYHGTPAGGFIGGIFNDTENSTGSSITWTLSEPLSSLYWWPAKQVLTDKIDSSEVWLTVPTGLKAGSNGLLQNEIDLGNGKTRFEWKHQHPIAYYLMSLAVGPYLEYNFNAALPGTSDVVFVQNFIYDDSTTLTNYQADIDQTADMLYSFSEFYGLYPFRDEKYGHCMAPMNGGMEHQTMTTQGFFVTGLTAHELGHQWFGNNVTCADWGHIWINEGFASYSEYLFLQTISQASAQQNMLNAHTSVMNGTTGSVYVPEAYQDQGLRIFDTRLTYFKGTSLVHMIRHWVNDDAQFFNALQVFQTTYAESNATAENFIQVIETETGVAMTDFLAHWYYGEGHPTYSGSFNEENNGVVVELNQTTSAPLITPFFASHIEIELVFTDNTDTVIHVYNKRNDQQFFFPIDKELASVSVDPDNWVLNDEDVFTKDANLTYTGVKEILGFDNSWLQMYPNPSSGFLQINLKNAVAVEGRIIDQLGRTVKQLSINNGINSYALELAKGVYFVTVEVNNQIFTEQLFVQ